MNQPASPGPAAQKHPTIRLKPGGQRRARHGHPWIYSNEIAIDDAARALEPGAPVTVASDNGQRLGTFFYNPRSLIAARLVHRDPGKAVDAALLAERLASARHLRDRLFDAPYYRLAHAEADGLPGTIVDRFGDVLVVQVNTAGMERLTPQLLEALYDTLRPESVLLRNDSPARAHEGLAEDVRMAKGRLDGPVSLVENGVTFFADPRSGQKTGWFYDQRDNRAMMARLAGGARMLDLYCYMGGFALSAAANGAASVIAVDRSESALALASQSAQQNGLDSRVEFRRGEAFKTLEDMSAAGEQFDIVVADPPAFAKSKKELHQGARGYQKLARLAAGLVAPGGFLFIASCSHNMPADLFGEHVKRGIEDAARGARILARTGAAADHPLHPSLPESAYLKAELIALD
jgi:23S rRNA (cytosine1962-C5)-methyltransferase